MDHDTIKALLEEYTLGMLDEAEHAQVAAHLSGCVACQRVVIDYSELLAQLPEVLAARSPHQLPEAVKSTLLQKLQAPPGVMIAPAPIRSDPQLLPTSSAPSPSFWDHFRLQPLRLAFMAALLLLLLALAWSVRLNVALARERALRAEFAALAAQQHELVLEIVDSSKTTRRLMLPPTKESRAYGKVYTRPDFPYVVAMAARLPAAPAEQAYHLWLFQGEKAQLAGLLKVSADGFGLLIYDAPNNEHNYTATQLTLQPEGTTTPASPPILLWQQQE